MLGGSADCSRPSVSRSLILTLRDVRKGRHRRCGCRIPRVRDLGRSDLRSSTHAPDVDRASIAYDNGWRRHEHRLRQHRTARPYRHRGVCGRFYVASKESANELTDLNWAWSGITRFSVGMSSAVDSLAYSRGLTCQSEAPTKAWYSAGEIDRLEYRHAITNMFLSCCQSLRTTSHSKVPPELTVIVRISPGFGMDFSSTSLPNRTSLFAMVSGASFPSRRTRREGILRLISTVCVI